MDVFSIGSNRAECGQDARRNQPRASTALADEKQYALRKRYLIPGWWLLGYVIQSLSTDLSLLPAEILNREVLFGADIPPRYFHLFCSIWTEMVKLLANGQGHLRHLSVRVDTFLRGTSREMTEQLELLESYWALPFRLSRLDGSSNGPRKKRGGRGGTQVNFVRESFVNKGERVVLEIDLGCCLEDFWNGRLGTRNFDVTDVVSLNPDVVVAFGAAKSMKKLSSYLLLEFARRYPLAREGQGVGWFGGLFDGLHLWTYHKDLRARTNSLYEHGVLGWEEFAPAVRVRDVRRQLVQGRSVGAAAMGPSVVHLVRVSPISQRATAIEENMRGTLPHSENVASMPMERPRLAPPLPNAARRPASEAVRPVRTVSEGLRPVSSPADVIEIVRSPVTEPRAKPLVEEKPPTAKRISRQSPEVSSPEPHVVWANFMFQLDEEKRQIVERMRQYMSQEDIMKVMSCIETNAKPPKRRR